MKILVVDDSKAMQTIVKRGIQQLGYDNIDIKKASNGEEALNIIRTWEPQLVLSDWHMPEMTGLELLQALNRQMLSVTIGFVTTESSEQRLQEARDAGAQFVVQKPFDTKTLHDAVLPIIQGELDSEKHLEEQHQQEQLSEHIILPSIENLAEKMNEQTSSVIRCCAAKPIELDNNRFPYMLGVYTDASQKAIHAMALADLPAICNMGVALGNVTEETVLLALADRALPKVVIENSRKLLKDIEKTLFNDAQKAHLVLRNANLMRKHNDRLVQLLEKGPEERLDVMIKVSDMDVGCLTFIVS